MSGTVEEVLLQNEDLLFSAAGVRCVIGKVRSARFDRCKVQQLQPEKMLATSHSGANVQYRSDLVCIVIVNVVVLYCRCCMFLVFTCNRSPLMNCDCDCDCIVYLATSCS